MLELKIRKKTKIKFSDELFSFQHGTEDYDYTLVDKFIKVDQSAGEQDEGIIYNIVKPNKRYKITIRATNFGSSSASRFWVMNDDGTNTAYSNSFPNYSISLGLPRWHSFYWESGSNKNIKWMIKGSGSSPSTQYAKVDLYNITISEVEYLDVDLVDNVKGIELNKSYRDTKNPEKYNNDYSSNFKLPTTKKNLDLIDFVDIQKNTLFQYDSLLEEDGLTIMGGEIIFRRIDLENVIYGVLFAEDSNFFNKIKSKELRELDLPDSTVNYENYLRTSRTSQSNYDADEPYFYNIINNGNITDDYWRSVGEKITITPNNVDPESKINYASGFNVNDVVPSVYVWKLWDKIHAEEGMTCSGTFLESEEFIGLLLNDFNNYKISKEEKNANKSSAKISGLTYFLEDELGDGISRTKEWDLTFEDMEGNDWTDRYFKPTKNLGLKINITVKMKFDTDSFNWGSSVGCPGIHLKLKVNASFGRRANYKPQPYTESMLYPLPTNLEPLTNPDNEILFGEEIIELDEDNKRQTVKFTAKIDANYLYEVLSTDQSFYTIRVKVTPQYYLQEAIGGLWDADLVPTPIQTEICKMTPSGKIKLTGIQKIVPGETFTKENILPKMKQIDFIKAVANLFNLRYIITGNNIEWLTYEEYMNKGELRNWSNKLHHKFKNTYFGNTFQTNEYTFSYKETKGDTKEAYESNVGLDYGVKIDKKDGDLETKTKKYNVGIGIQAIEQMKYNLFYIAGTPYANEIFITNNHEEQKDTTISSVDFNKVGKKPFFSYQNVVPSPPTTFRDERLEKHNIQNISVSSHIMNPRIQNTGEDIFTLAFQEPDWDVLYDTTEFIKPTRNLYDSFFHQDFQDILDKYAEKMTGQIYLDTLEFNDLKMNDIIQIDDKNYRVEEISEWNKNKISKVKLLKTNFNNYYVGTVVTPSPFIDLDDYSLSWGSAVVHTVYTSTPKELSFNYSNIVDDIVIKNVGVINNYQVSLDGGTTWLSFNAGTTRTIVTGSASGTASFHIRIIGSGSSIGTSYVSSIEVSTLNTSGIKYYKICGLYTKVSTFPTIVVLNPGFTTIDVVTPPDPINVIGGFPLMVSYGDRFR